MAIEYPSDLIERLELLEQLTQKYTGGEVANALVYDKWNHRPKFKNVFFYEPERELIDLLKQVGLGYVGNFGYEPYDSRFKEDLFETKEIFWSRLMSVYGAYLTSQKITTINYLDLLILPMLKIMGVNITTMMGSLDHDLTRAYLFTLGGDVIQDRILGYRSPWDYRGDILGLVILNKNKDVSRRFSNVTKEAFDQRRSIEGDSYKEHPLFRSAWDNCNPKGIDLLRKTGILKRFYDSIVSGVHLKRHSRKFE